MKKNLNAVYEEAEQMARGGGSQVSATERGMGHRAASGPPRRRRTAQEREAEEVVMEGDVEEEEEQQADPSEAREDSDSLPPADGFDAEGEGEAEEEGGPEQEADSGGGVPPWSCTAPRLAPSCREAVACTRRFLVRL